MKTISNADYQEALRLLRHLSRKKGDSLSERNASRRAGLCSEERSMISPDYARNFICDFILGKPQVNTQLTLF